MEPKVIARYVVLFLALVNQFLSSIILTGVALYTTYKDNPTTKEGKWANQKLKKYKAEKKYRKATGQAPVKNEDIQPTNLDELG